MLCFFAMEKKWDKKDAINNYFLHYNFDEKLFIFGVFFHEKKNAVKKCHFFLYKYKFQINKKKTMALL